MPNQITLTVLTGTPPYQVSVCDITNTYCYYAITFGGGTITFDSPAPLEYTTPILIKIIDSRNCESFQYYQCVPTPTPTLTPTLTPTPTGPCTCCCLAVSCNNSSGGTFTYTDCFGNVIGDVFVAGNSIVYYCGSNVTNLENVVVNYGSPCVEGSCVLPIPTLTPTPTSTQNGTQTPTPTNTPTLTHTLTQTLTSTPTNTPTNTPTLTQTNTPTLTQTNTPTLTQTNTPTLTQTLTQTLTPTPTLTRTLTPTPTPSCFQYTIVSGPFGARVSFNGCCGNSGETSIILTLPTEIQKCSTTLPIVFGGTATITLFGPCPSC